MMNLIAVICADVSGLLKSIIYSGGLVGKQATVWVWLSMFAGNAIQNFTTRKVKRCYIFGKGGKWSMKSRSAAEKTSERILSEVIYEEHN